MMKRSWRSDICLILCGVLIWLLADAAHIRTAAAEALGLCARSVIPAMFPFLAVTGLLVSLGFGQWLSPLCSGLMGPLFRLPGVAGSALVLGLVGGYPIGAKTAAELYRQKLLTWEEAIRLLTFCNNSNPVFLISVLGAGLFGSVRTGIWLWLIHILSALLTGLLFRGTGKNDSRRTPAGIPALPSESFPSAFVAAVRNAAGGMLSICAFVVLFSVLASPLKALSGVFAPLLVGALELFSAAPLLTADRTGFVLSAALSGWGGLSVLCQTAAVLEGSDLPLRWCFWGKLTQGLLSAVLALALSGYVLP